MRIAEGEVEGAGATSHGPNMGYQIKMPSMEEAKLQINEHTVIKNEDPS